MQINSCLTNHLAPVSIHNWGASQSGTSGKSDYNALQAQYERRFTHGLQFTGSFTWSKTLDDSCGNLGVCQPQFCTDYALERGLSTQDQDYAVVLSVIRTALWPRKRVGQRRTTVG
jgi:hypothetical protein